MTTGIFASLGSDFTSASTSCPFLRGKLRSRIMRSGMGASTYFPWCRKKEMASAPSLTALTWKCWLLWASTSLVRSISAGLSSTIRSSGVFIVLSLLCRYSRFERKRKFESRSVTELGLDPDSAAVLFDDFLANRKADSVAGILRPGIQPSKDDEYALRVFGRDPDAIVGYRKDPFLCFCLRAHADDGRIWPAKLDAVSNEVLKYLHHLGAVG